MSICRSGTVRTTLEGEKKVRYWDLFWEITETTYSSGVASHKIDWKLLPKNNTSDSPYLDGDGNWEEPLVSNTEWHVCSANVSVEVTGGNLETGIVCNDLGDNASAGTGRVDTNYDFRNDCVPDNTITNFNGGSRANLYVITFVDGSYRYITEISKDSANAGDQMVLCSGSFIVKGGAPTLTFSITMDSYQRSTGNNLETGVGTWELPHGYYTLTVIPNGGSLVNGDNKEETEPFQVRFTPGRVTYIGNWTSSYTIPNQNPCRDYYHLSRFEFSNGSGGVSGDSDRFYVSTGSIGYQGSDYYVFNGDYEGDVTATAIWDPNTLQIIYNARGAVFPDGGYTHASPILTYGEVTTLQTVEELGLHLIGNHPNELQWVRLGVANTPAIDPTIERSVLEIATVLQCSSGLKSAPHSEAVLHANWEVNTYIVTIVNAEVDQEILEVTHGESTRLYGTLSPREGYTFSHFTSNAGSIEQEDFILVEDDIPHGSNIIVTGNWEVNKGIIYFHSNGARPLSTSHSHTVDSNGISSLTQEFTYENSKLKILTVEELFEKQYHYIPYSATAWIIGEPVYSGDELVSPQWSALNNETSPKPWLQYQDFMNQHLTPSGEEVSSTNSQPVELKGWVKDGDCEIHLYPNWSPTYLKVTYLLTDSSDNVFNSKSFKYKYNEEAKIDSLNTIWGTMADTYANGFHVSDSPWKTFGGTELVTPSVAIAYELAVELCDAGVIDDDLLCTPQLATISINWERNSYTITYDSAGGSPISNTEAQYNLPTPISSEVPTKSGYIFGGWKHVDTNLTSTYQPGGNIVVTYAKEQEVPLYAIWTAEGSTTPADGGACYIKIGGSWRPAVVRTKIMGEYR